jgi:Holliday junction resolvasome RuvABC DNA-binding subunit
LNNGGVEQQRVEVKDLEQGIMLVNKEFAPHRSEAVRKFVQEKADYVDDGVMQTAAKPIEQVRLDVARIIMEAQSQSYQVSPRQALKSLAGLDAEQIERAIVQSGIPEVNRMPKMAKQVAQVITELKNELPARAFDSPRDIQTALTARGINKEVAEMVTTAEPILREYTAVQAKQAEKTLPTQPSIKTLASLSETDIEEAVTKSEIPAVKNQPTAAKQGARRQPNPSAAQCS